MCQIVCGFLRRRNATTECDSLHILSTARIKRKGNVCQAVRRSIKCLQSVQLQLQYFPSYISRVRHFTRTQNEMKRMTPAAHQIGASSLTTDSWLPSVRLVGPQRTRRLATPARQLPPCDTEKPDPSTTRVSIRLKRILSAPVGRLEECCNWK